MTDEAQNPRRKLTPDQVASITSLIKENKLSQREIAHNFGINESLVRYYKRKAKLSQPARETKNKSVRLQLSEINSYVAVLSREYFDEIMKKQTDKAHAFVLNQMDRGLNRFTEIRKSLIELGVDDESSAIYADDEEIGRITSSMSSEDRQAFIQRIKRASQQAIES